MNKQQKEKIVVRIENPGCFLPSTNKEIKVLLNKLKLDTEWKLATTSDLKNPNLEGLLAQRDFKYTKITLIKIKNKKKWFYNPNGILDEGRCDGKTIQLFLHYDKTSGALGSSLLFENNKVGLLIREWSFDPKRESTKEALKVVHNDFINKFEDVR
jgi:hypothetical protein